MTCKRRCLERFLFFSYFFLWSQEEGAAATLHHPASVGNVFFTPAFLCATFAAFAPRGHWPTNHRELDYCFLNEAEWVTALKKKKKSIQVPKELSNEAAHLTRSHHQSKYYRQPQNKLYSREVLVTTLALSLSLSPDHCALSPFLFLLSTLSWLANECRWRSGGCSGLITGAMRARCELSMLQSGGGERFNCFGESPHLNKQRG